MLTPDYVVGLVDGEGSFTAYIRNPNQEKTVKRRTKAEPRFYVTLQERDREVLEELKKFFSCGNVYYQKDKRENHTNCYRYDVVSRQDLNEKIIPFFRKYKLKTASRRNDFQIFAEIMQRINKGEHLTKSGLEKLYSLKQKMH